MKRAANLMWMWVALSSMAAISTAQASGVNGFCWAQKLDGVHCTEIGPSPFPAPAVCTSWATSIGASRSGQVRDSDLARLQGNQDQACNYVGSKLKYVCFIKKFCGVTTSMKQTHLSVFTLDAASAVSACVDRAAPQYSEALKTAGLGCSIAAYPVLTLP